MVRKYDAIFCRFFCKFVRINFQIFYFNTKATLDHLVDFHYVSFGLVYSLIMIMVIFLE